jgi:hypothetical protein
MLLSFENTVVSVAIGAGLWIAGALFIRARHETMFPEVTKGGDSVTSPTQGLIFAALPPVALLTMQIIKPSVGLTGPDLIFSSLISAVTILFMDAFAVSYTSVYLVPKHRLFLTAGSLLWAVGWFLLAAYLVA